MKLSIITINYNNLEGLKKTVESVLAQTWRDFEWIIVDGGSTDGSKEYIESLAQSLSEGTAIDRVQWNVERFSLPGFTADDLKNPEVAQSSNRLSSIDNRQSSIANRQSSIDNRSQRLLWCSEPDKGIYNAMNKGIAKATGEYVNFMNSGDCFHCQETLLSVFSKQPTADVLYGDCVLVKGDGKDVVEYPRNLSLSFFVNRGICHQTSFVKRDLFRNFQYNEDLRLASDWEFFLSWFIAGKCFTHSGEVIANYDGMGMSSIFEERLDQERDAVLSHFFVQDTSTFVAEFARLQAELSQYNQYEYQAAKRLIKRGHVRKHFLDVFLKFIDFFDRKIGQYY